MSTLPRACILVVFLLLAAPRVCAQAGASSVRLSGQVSGAAAVSVHEARDASEGARVSFARVDTNSVAVTISGSGDGTTRVTLPVKLRSNVGFELSASLLSADDLTVALSVDGVEVTGKFVHAAALAAIKADEGLAAPLKTAQHQTPLVNILSGPPVSSAGTFDSPDNAIEVSLVVDVKPPTSGAPWSARLTLTAAPK